jgi:hypothetical protein
MEVLTLSSPRTIITTNALDLSDYLAHLLPEECPCLLRALVAHLCTPLTQQFPEANTEATLNTA